ncbi:MAG TPA: ABC transporter permease [Acidimicrobiaceae bacterium]|nr:ABC transporter permease [Acidimicrobiaceae bacterium]
MRLEVVRLELLARRRSTLGYAVGMGLYTFVIVALYPSFQHDTSLDKITKSAPTLSALFGAIGSLTSPTGWLNANIYENFFPLMMLLLAIGYGASSIAGRDEEGTLALLATLPIARARLVAQKVLSLVVQGLALASIVAVMVIVGRSFHLALPVGHVVEASLATLLLGLDLGLLTMAVGARTGSRGTALGVGSAIAAASYLVSSLAPVVAWVRPARFASLFYWSIGNGQLSTGLTLTDAAVLVLVALAAGVVSIRMFAHMDLH